MDRQTGADKYAMSQWISAGSELSKINEDEVSTISLSTSLKRPPNAAKIYHFSDTFAAIRTTNEKAAMTDFQANSVTCVQSNKGGGTTQHDPTSPNGAESEPETQTVRKAKERDEDRVSTKVKYTVGSIGTPSTLDVTNEVFTRTAKQELKQSLSASGTLVCPARPPLLVRSSKEECRQRVADDKHLGMLSAKLNKAHPTWSPCTAYAISECVKSSNEDVPASLKQAIKNFRPRSKKWRCFGPIFEELWLWNKFNQLFRELCGNDKHTLEEMEHIMWKAYFVVKPQWIDKKLDQKFARKVKQRKQRNQCLDESHNIYDPEETESENEV